LAHMEPPLAVATNEKQTVHAVLAGDVYNARQLRTGLVGRHALATRDDAEVVVHLYEERGVQCVKALRGAFAVALWDERPQRLLKRADLPRLIREQVLEALRLRQAGRVSGLLLSGGLDAAALLALAAADRRLPARAYTAAFADGDQELGAAAEHAARAGVDHV